jgi:hypothetical protein
MGSLTCQYYYFLPDTLNSWIGSVKTSRYGVIFVFFKISGGNEPTPLQPEQRRCDRGFPSLRPVKQVKPYDAVACIADVVFGCPACAARPPAAENALLELGEMCRGGAEFAGIPGKAARITEGEVSLLAQGCDLLFQANKQVFLAP